MPPRSKRNEIKQGQREYCCPRSKCKEMGGGGNTTAPFEMERNGGVHAPRLNKNSPPQPGGIIELERAGVWFSRRLVGFWNKKMGRRGHELPPPSLAVSPPSSFPIPLPPGSPLVPPCSHLSISAPTSLEEGRGSHSDTVRSVHRH